MKNFDLEHYAGLNDLEAAEKLKADGYNELPTSKKRSVFRIAIEVVKEPMFLLLVLCGVMYLLLGDINEALLLLGFVFVIMGITFVQEQKTERALEALRDLSSPRALVMRGGKQIRIPGREVVRGDTIVLSEGDRVPADAIVLQSINLSADESLLTGESVAARKSIWNKSKDEAFEIGIPGGDDLPFVYSGSMIVQGQGIAVVVGTGISTEIGKIGVALRSVEIEETLLKKETGRLVRNLAIAGGVLCLIVILIFGFVRFDWIQGFLAGLTLAMAILPEEFPVVLTIYLALGAWRLSKKNVLARRIPVVETLGAATVLCVDKTGTLTMNQMGISEIYANGNNLKINEESNESIPENFHELIEYGILASREEPFDPMEKALKKLGELKLSGTEHIHIDWQLVEEYPLSKELLAMSNVWKSESTNKLIISAKGAPEAILDLCHLSGGKIKELSRAVDTMSSNGLRVIGVAQSSIPIEELPDNQHDFDFRFIGFVGFADPVRATVPEAIKECYKAGIRVIMITGDHPGTAQSIGKQIGLNNYEKFITGPELNLMTDNELEKRIRDINIFCRVVPEQKMKLVNALKADNEIVAMTGDGVNDAPALKSAHIGIAMGGRGTDVARESASLVLLDDDFNSIVGAVKMGRRIFDNLKKAMSYIFSIHVPIAGLSLLPLLINKDLILFPIHIVFLQLIIDPACSVVFEAEKEEADLLRRKPRNVKERLFGKSNVLICLLQGFGVLIACSIPYYFGIEIINDQSKARAMAFTTLIIANVCLISTNRSLTESIFTILKEKNTAFYFVLTGAVIFLGIALYVPAVRELFKFSYLHLNDVMMCLAAGMLSISWFELYKFIKRKQLIAG